MFKTSVVMFFALAAVGQPQTFVKSEAAGYAINAGSITLKSGVRVSFRSVAIPDATNLNLIATGFNASDNVVHRFVLDKTTSSYFGYDLVIGTSDATNRYPATFQRLTASEKILSDISGTSSLRPMMLPKYPPPQLVREGDLIELDLMVSADGKHKLTDYLEVLPPPGSPATDPGPGSSDFTIDDGPVAFEGVPHGLWVNGESKDLNAFTAKPGATFWIAFPGQGRYILSLTPHDGFLKNGTLHGDTISFQDGGQRYDVRYQAPIAGRGKLWNLYVLHDTSYQPNPALKEMVSGGTDRLENLWPKR